MGLFQSALQLYRYHLARFFSFVYSSYYFCLAIDWAINLFACLGNTLHQVLMIGALYRR